MIKKTTRAIFVDGDFKGEYDWQGGIPLSLGEQMTVKINGKTLKYRLTKKDVSCDVLDADQTVEIVYTFRLDL